MEIIVKPGKRKTEIVGERDGVLVVNVKGKAENNEANNEVLGFFGRKLGKQVKIVKGFKSKRKVLKIFS